MAKKLPAFQFYVGDWLKDAELRRCSKAAKGVWIDMICLSFECEDRGVFASGGVPWPDRDIAAAVGGDIAENLNAITELLTKGVCSRNQSGAVFCRRVVRDEQKRRKCSEAGKKGGGNPALTYKGGSKGHSKGGLKRNSKASSSPSGEDQGHSPPNPLLFPGDDDFDLLPKKPEPPSEVAQPDRKRKQVELSELDFPDSLDTIEVRQAVADWLEYKTGRKEFYKQPAYLNGLIKDFELYGPAALVQSIRVSIGNLYQGFFVKPAASVPVVKPTDRTSFSITDCIPDDPK